MNLMSYLLTSQKALNVEKNLKTTVQRDGETVKRMRILYGPYKIKGLKDTSGTKYGNSKSADPAGTAFMYLAKDFPKDVTLITANTTWVWKDGSEARVDQGVYNHHHLVVDMAKTKPTKIAECPDGTGVGMGVPLFSGSAEDGGGSLYSTKNGEFPSGYYLPKNSRVMITGDVVNYKDETQEIYSLTDIQYIEGQPKALMQAANQIWDLGRCSGDSEMTGALRPPPGQKKWSIQSSPMKIVQDGYILAFRKLSIRSALVFITSHELLGGHLHDGGVSLDAELNGKQICSSQAIYNGAPLNKDKPEEKSVNEMAYCYPADPIKVSVGDTIMLKAHYDFEAHPARMQHGGMMAEEMALMSVFFAGPDVN